MRARSLVVRGYRRLRGQATPTEGEPVPEARPEPEPGPEHVAGGLDLPHHQPLVVEAPIEVTGWAFSTGAPIVRIDVGVGGQHLGPARLGLPRRDAEEVHPVPDAIGAGFAFLLDPAALAGGPADTELIATVVTASGTSHRLDPLHLRLVPSPPASPSRSPQRPAPARAATTRAEGEVHLLAFSHDLLVGGAQSYLSDIVGRLHARPGFRCTVVAAEDGPLRDDLERAGAAVLLARIRSDEPTAHQASVGELAAWARDHGVTAVLANTALAFGGIHVAVRCGVPSVWSIHESWSAAELSRRWSEAGVHPEVVGLAGAAFAEASAVSFVCEATRQLFADRVDGARTVVIPNAVDVAELDSAAAAIDRARARELLGLGAADEVVVCVGSVEPRKGQAVLARAARLLSDARPRLQVALVGGHGDEYQAAIDRFARAVGIGGRVRVVPWSDRPATWYQAADVVVCASDNESLPGVVLEAMAMRVPVVGSRAFGIPEVVEDGETGYLCDPSDVGSLASALRRALDAPPDERAGITARARHRVEERHDAVQRADSVWQLLGEVGARRTGLSDPAG